MPSPYVMSAMIDVDLGQRRRRAIVMLIMM
jgi:hypothetical protein